MLGQKTVNALLSLKPSGSQSFEDLLRELLSELTGQPYHLCASGWQGGVDGVVASGSIGFEAKRYGETDLNIRSLQGEIVQAVRERQNLELWILATTGRLGAQDRQQLNDTAENQGVALLTLAEGDASVPFHPLAGLCALLPDRVREVLADPAWKEEKKKGRSKKVVPTSLNEIREDLDSITNSKELASFHAELREKIQELPTWKLFVERHNQRVKRAILQSSKVVFGTHFEHSKVIPRKVKAEMDQWLNSTMAKHEPRVAAVLGERFDGKTWAAFDWLADRIDSLDVPVFLIGSNVGDVLDQLDQMLRTEVERSLGSYSRHAGALLDRRRRWSAGRAPWCLLILDGLNEYKRPDKPWQRHLADAYARTEAKFRPAAVLCTVRARSWPDIEEEVRQATGSQDIQLLSVGSFDDAEFMEALRRAGKAPEEIASLPPGAQTLIRRPRFFQLVLDHSPRLGNFEIVNEDVLYWLDVSDKLRRDRPGSPARWTEEMYQEVLLDLAKQSIERHALRRKDVLDILEDQTRLESEVGFDDLLSEGVLSERGLKFSLRPEHLRTGVGLYILDLLDQPGIGQEDLRERLRDFLAPYNEDDTAAAWLRRASVFALLSERVSTEAIDLLVDEWLRTRNRPPDHFEQLKAVAPLLLLPLLRLAPRTWTRSTGHRGLQELSILIFSENLDREKGLIQGFVRLWCRFVPVQGPSFLEDKPDPAGLVRAALQDESLTRLGLQARGDAGLLRLQNVVLYLESLSPGLVGADDLLAVLAVHHIPFYYFSDSGPWILRRAMARFPREWFEKWAQIASLNRSSKLAEVVLHLLDLVERADLENLRPLVEPQASEEEDAFAHFRSLDRAGYEAIRITPFQDDEKPTRFLVRVRHLVIEPELPPPGRERLEESRRTFRETFSEVKLHLHNASTREDHLFRDATAAISAWMPEEGTSIVLRQIEDLANRFREDNHWWVLSVYRHAVLAAGPAREHLATAAATQCPDENGRMAPGYALQILLPGMTSENAVNAILHHHLDFEWSVFYEFAACLDVDGLRSHCLAALNEEASPRERIRAYHLLSELGAPALSDAQIRLLQQDIEEGDAELRVAALGCAAACNVTGLPPYRLLTIALDTEEDRKTFGPRNAAWLLIQDGHFLDRLPPYWRAVAAVVHPARREQLLQEVEGAFANDVEEAQELPGNYVLQVQHGVRPVRNRLSLPDDDRSLLMVSPDSTLGGFDDEVKPETIDELFNQDLYFKKRNRQIQEGLDILRRRQQEHQTAWSYEQFPQELIDGLPSSRFEQWVEAMLRDEQRTWFDWEGLVIPLFRRALRRGHPATARLWDFVHPFSSESRPGVIRYLDRGIDWVLHELSGPQADDVLARQLLRELVLDARTDRQLFEIALGARFQGPSRLMGLAAELLESRDAAERARAARLLGWLEGTEGRLRELAQADASLWVRRIAEESLKERQREGFARHWLKVFLYPDLPREHRWGAGQLFLEAVDSGFRAWAYAFVRETAPDARTRGEGMLLLNAAREEVKQRPSEKQFLGTKVTDLESGCHPWQRRRTWYELEQRF